MMGMHTYMFLVKLVFLKKLNTFSGDILVQP